MRIKCLLAALCLFGVAASNASALSINFGDAQPWASYDGDTSGTTTIDGIDVTVTAYSGVSYLTGRLEWNDNEGFGVRHLLDLNRHAIESNEAITVNFSSPIALTELSFAGANSNERGRYSIGGVTNTFSGTSNGLVTLALNNVLASSIRVSGIPRDWRSSFVLHNIVGSKTNPSTPTKDDSETPVTDVPEPASMLLLGSSLLGLGALGRRKR